MYTSKDFQANIIFDIDDGIYVGEVLGVQNSLNFYGRTLEEAIHQFHQSVEYYLELQAVSDKLFYSEPNLAHLRRGISALNDGKGVEHDIIESDASPQKSNNYKE